MEEDRKLTPREREILNRQSSRTGAENRNSETRPTDSRKGEDTLDEHRADMNGKVGKFETEHTEPTGEGSDVAGAETKDEVGTSSAGAGLGGNKGTGTRKKSEFQ